MPPSISQITVTIPIDLAQHIVAGMDMMVRQNGLEVSEKSLRVVGILQAANKAEEMKPPQPIVPE